VGAITSIDRSRCFCALPPLFLTFMLLSSVDLASQCIADGVRFFLLISEICAILGTRKDNRYATLFWHSFFGPCISPQ
jgi:hypothetical protein